MNYHRSDNELCMSSIDSYVSYESECGSDACCRDAVLIGVSKP